jgi:hypothetical protein
MEMEMGLEKGKKKRRYGKDLYLKSLTSMTKYSGIGKM